MKTIKAWIGLSDGEMYFSRQPDAYKSGSAVVADVYKFKREACERWHEVIQVEIKPLKKRKKRLERPNHI